jgi:hypothetical protein
VIAYRAMLDVPRALVAMVAGSLSAERRPRGPRRNRRPLTSWYQALLVLVWYRKREEMTALGTGFGVARATAYGYRDEAIAVLHVQAPIDGVAVLHALGGREGHREDPRHRPRAAAGAGRPQPRTERGIGRLPDGQGC